MVGELYKRGTLHLLYPYRYKRYTKRPVDENKIVFLEIRQPGLSDNFRLLYKALEKKNRYDLKLCYVGEGTEGRLTAIKNSLNCIKDLADAKYIFVNESSYLTGCLPLRKETKLIQTWHACGAFKKFGYSVADKKFGAGTKVLDRFPLHRNFSWVTVSSKEVIWAYAQAFHMEQEQQKILPIGVSRTDYFFQKENVDNAREKLKSVLGEYAAGKKIILYAPTFRGKVAQAVSPDILDFRRMREYLGEEYIFLCKHHPFVKIRPAIPKECREYALDVTELMEIEELLLISDVCITDYSSLVFEYSLLERPIIFLAHDLEEYYDWRGFYYPYEEMAPGPIVRTTEDVIEYLKNLENGFDKERVHRFREKFMGACDGHATQRLIQLLENGEIE